MELTSLFAGALMWVCANSHFECKDQTINNLPQIELVEYSELHKRMTNEDYIDQDKDYLASYRGTDNSLKVYKNYEEIIPGLTLEEIFVHEAVHFLQDNEGPVPKCIANGEYEAYMLQIKWQKQNDKPEWLNRLWLLMLEEEQC